MIGCFGCFVCNVQVVGMVGVVTVGQPMLLVLDYCSVGSLISYLRKSGSLLNNRMKLHMGAEILDAMLYLAERGVVHRDVAARNVT